MTAKVQTVFTGDGVRLVLQREPGQVVILVCDEGLMIGRLLVAADAVEVIQSGMASGTLIKWEA